MSSRMLSILAMAGETHSGTSTIATGAALVTVVHWFTGDTICEFARHRGIATLSGLKAQVQARTGKDPSQVRLIHKLHELVDDCSVRRALLDKKVWIQIVECRPNLVCRLSDHSRVRGSRVRGRWLKQARARGARRAVRHNKSLFE